MRSPRAEKRKRDMDRAALEKEIKRLKDELEDLEDTFTFNLTNTSAHLRSGLVAEHEDELNELRKKIAGIEGLLEK